MLNVRLPKLFGHAYKFDEVQYGVFQGVKSIRICFARMPVSDAPINGQSFSFGGKSWTIIGDERNTIGGGEYVNYTILAIEKPLDLTM